MEENPKVQGFYDLLYEIVSILGNDKNLIVICLFWLGAYTVFTFRDAPVVKEILSMIVSGLLGMAIGQRTSKG